MMDLLASILHDHGLNADDDDDVKVFDSLIMEKVCFIYISSYIVI